MPEKKLNTKKNQEEKSELNQKVKSAMHILEDMVKLAQEKGLSELELKFEDFKARISWQAVTAAQPVLSGFAAKPAPTGTNTANEKPSLSPGTVQILAPLTGVFYRSPLPGAPSFVEAGDKVEPGTVLCIVEAMKLMNELNSEVSGEIVQILAKNAQLVEKGAPLFHIKLD